jgi:transposase
LKSGGNRKSVIGAQLHESLSTKLNDSNNPLRGYWDGVLWVKTHHGIDIKYNTLRTYLIRHFHTKLKSPRKSHYKKDEQAIEAFKKTT